ncbi:MAG TPA: flagellar export chaperone FlgN [Lachnospiraceae bacterium]|nr:flagellar export chaperone FlgN [Lachnospiraceae bacterium]
MPEQNNYIEVMLKSLRKKVLVLDGLIDKCEEQADIIRESEIDWEAFDINVSEKQALIDELVQLDEGFEKIYKRIKANLLEHKEQYSDDIKEMQELITLITDKSVRIQADEERNRRIIEKSLAVVKKDIKASRTSVKAATDYYKSMSRVNYVDPQFMDKKK